MRRSQQNILILAEDEGTHLSFAGTSGMATPNMDRIAKEGAYDELVSWQKEFPEAFRYPALIDSGRVDAW